jgi:outer membrane protein assembly factor BamB
VLEDGPELKVLAKNDIGEEIIATPSIADGRLYVRTRENLFCVAAGGSKPVLAEKAAMPTTIEITSQPVSGSRVWNGYTGNAMGQESWSEAELELRLQQLKKLGYTTVAIPKAVALHADSRRWRHRRPQGLPRCENLRESRRGHHHGPFPRKGREARF